MRFLFLLFVGVPILEMWLLIEVGSRIGALPTIALVALTAFIGVNLLRQQGFSTLTRAQTRLNAGEVPATEILEGLFLAVGGALLLTPGFFTDTVGFCCLIGPIRRRIIDRMLKSGLVHAHTQGGFQAGGFKAGESKPEQYPPQTRVDRDGHVTIDGEYKREE
ncbi:UPF0716 protein FxsA [Litorivivens lipolytica]|uniref:UPF0716 protein FxsA n=1 Tax=Litorivivens lipolytica TaxID=1524264 RepID=A0A7W4W4U5_9GAMM|nr:FxsA family protein [Litorivivens lipolytica]MBB3046919.1 UPF0716 protein FxsA [Litorivivens lipolytica]